MTGGFGMGGLQELHDHESAGELAEAVTRAAARFYGTAGRAWLKWACAHHAELPELLTKRIERYRGEIVPESASEQVRAMEKNGMETYDIPAFLRKQAD